jgi:hypothetical protein
VYFVNNVDFESGPVGAIDGILTKLANVIDFVVGGTIDLDNVYILTLVDGCARGTFAAGFWGGSF